MKKAQTRFNRWLKFDEKERTVESLLEALNFDYFKLLDLLTIARSRKHIEKYYDMAEIGEFPERAKPVNIKADIDTEDLFPPLREINRDIRRLNLSAYAPLKYVLPQKLEAYSRKYDMQVAGGSVFKQIDREETRQLIRETCYSANSEFLKELLKKGYNPVDQEGDGPSLIQSLIQGMGYALDFDSYREIRRKNIDTSRTREKIKMVHILAKEGVNWSPNGRPEIAEARRSFLRLEADYTVEFIWIMSKYKACKRQELEELIRTPAIRALISDHMKRVKELLDSFNDNEDPTAV